MQPATLEMCRAVLSGETESCRVPPSGERTSDLPDAILPGSFDPLHRAHLRMAEIADQYLVTRVAWEISVKNVDKETLGESALVHRLRQFDRTRFVWLTQAATFQEKAILFPRCTFVVGADTMVRIGDPAYYGGSVTARDEAIEHIAGTGCRFLVFGRTDSRRFWTLSNTELPDSLQRICRQVPESQFRDDISSTELRRGRGHGA